VVTVALRVMLRSRVGMVLDVMMAIALRHRC
jgi:hypothetical protein